MDYIYNRLCAKTWRFHSKSKKWRSPHFTRITWEKELVLKLHRIQGITIKESILRQPFGYCAVQVEVIQSKGTDDEKKKLHCIQSFEKIEYSSYSRIYNYHTNWIQILFHYQKQHYAAISLIASSFRNDSYPAYWYKYILWKAFHHVGTNSRLRSSSLYLDTQHLKQMVTV